MRTAKEIINELKQLLTILEKQWMTIKKKLVKVQ